jgi:hypothetical protein
MTTAETTARRHTTHLRSITPTRARIAWPIVGGATLTVALVAIATRRDARVMLSGISLCVDARTESARARSHAILASALATEIQACISSPRGYGTAASLAGALEACSEALELFYGGAL